ncbi:MAG: DinB family protein [Gemmatimonadota bacterium]|jgi:uncharacterized damage-inducible protein DinB
MIDDFRELYDYHRWANRRVLDAVGALDAVDFEREVGGSFGSIRATLVHTLGADWVWLARWRGTSPTALPGSWDLSTFDALRARWAGVEEEQRAFVEGLGEADAGRKLTYRNLAGEPFENTLAEMLRHVVNHATYHRGQVVTLLRQLGAEAVSTDLILYYRTRDRA